MQCGKSEFNWISNEFDEEAPMERCEIKPIFDLETGCSYGALPPGGNLLEYVLPQRRIGAKDFIKNFLPSRRDSVPPMFEK